MTKFAIAMIAYAVALLGIGALTYLAAPPEANALTALIVPGIGAVLAIACVVLAFQIHTKRTLGMVGIHVGMVVPLVLAVGAFARLPGSLSKNAAYYDKQSIKLPTDSGPQVTLSSAKDYPTGYQAVGIGSVGVLSSFAFIVILLLRPKPPAKSPVPVERPAPQPSLAATATPPQGA
ncbi:MAG: hypothetical protein ACKVZJ_13525 [Phycisphaerales bacterium]